MTTKITGKYEFAIWRRKSSTASVKLIYNWSGNFEITKPNGSSVSMKEYFGGNEYLLLDAMYPLYALWDSYTTKFDAQIKISGGGMKWQAEAIRLAFARALITINAEYRPQLKPLGLLKRDPRRKERKKPGLFWARKRPQWSKR